ncbi:MULTISPECIES: YdiU family protein [Gammaproteobacteria]|uniref:protein adenylyltransferase SelO n=1 Tax=Gammaproteobacteria TaxID=1236 RepID=UPI000DD06B8D|nr:MULTISPECIES: YdiU family protein [Gammaproteobacteria]RTE85794.1 YdiU family protein [Aliidiomarina sp. B3213]TCZ90204.1 YdiU family protein [Lysobacter sp. N42]
MSQQARFLNLSSFFWQPCQPTPVKAPQWMVWNQDLAQQLKLPEELQYQHRESQALDILAGNQELPICTAFAATYAGHQFGYFNPQLGDGRAITLGEVKDSHGDYWELQLKGAGKTPYSRSGDGRSPIGPVIREYLLSEYMHKVGVPTTRALAAVATGDWVYREDPEPGAILTRMAQSHLRVGSFQYAAAHGGAEKTQELVEFVIQHYFPQLQHAPFPALALLDEVVNKQAQLIAHWMQIGFIHGVMNTDNMSILGDTIDYGPCAFMDDFKADQFYSFIDKNGRYRYSRQPAIAQWNLSRFAESLLTIHIPQRESQEQAVDELKSVIQQFKPKYEQAYYSGMLKKLGMPEVETIATQDVQLIDNYLSLLEADQLDYTRSFLALEALLEEGETENLFPANESWEAWLKEWKERLKNLHIREEQAVATMQATNPSVIPRNHLIAQAIEEVESSGSLKLFNQLQEVFATPYNRTLVNDSFAQPPQRGQEIENTFCGT